MQTIHDLISVPFKYVYFNGPRVMGFWHGKDAADACSELTRVPATVWHQQEAACDALLSKDFTAFCIGLGLVVGGVTAWRLMDICAWRAILGPYKLRLKETNE